MSEPIDEATLRIPADWMALWPQCACEVRRGDDAAYTLQVRQTALDSRLKRNGLTRSTSPEKIDGDPSPDSQNPTENHNKNKGQKP